MTATKPAASASSASTEAATSARDLLEARERRLGAVARADGGDQALA